MEERDEKIKALTRELPRRKPRLLAGVGSPIEVIQAICLGVDLIHSAYPDSMTELCSAMIFPLEMSHAEHSQRGKRKREDSSPAEVVTQIDLQNKVYAADDGPILKGCGCYSCTHHSRAYLHHLFMTKEMLGAVLLSVHNNTHYSMFFQAIRGHIAKGLLDEYQQHIQALFNK